MQLPVVGAATFSRFSDYCRDVRGRSIPEGTPDGLSWHIIVCLGEDDVCRRPQCSEYNLAAKRVILHELAHVWMTQHLADDVQQAFMELRGLSEWG